MSLPHHGCLRSDCNMFVYSIKLTFRLLSSILEIVSSRLYGGRKGQWPKTPALQHCVILIPMLVQYVIFHYAATTPKIDQKFGLLTILLCPAAGTLSFTRKHTVLPQSTHTRCNRQQQHTHTCMYLSTHFNKICFFSYFYFFAFILNLAQE